MIKVCLDTNALHENWLASGEAFTLLAEVIAQGGCEAFMSEVSILEHVRHYAKTKEQIESQLKSSLANYSKLFVEKTEATVSPELCDAATFEKRFRARLQELGVKVLPIPNIPHSELLARDLGEKKPFLPSGKGYRDALMWLGFLGALNEHTTQAVLVTSNSNDFCGKDKTALHPDLLDEIAQKSPHCEGLLFAAPQKLVDQLVKPLLKSLQEQEAKEIQKILKSLQDGTHPHVELQKVVVDGLEEAFEPQEAVGVFYAGDAVLEEPLYVANIEAADDIEATELFKLSDGSYVCEGTARVSATVDGFLDKFEAIQESEQGHVFISTPNWNDHYSEVEVSDVPAIVTFSFQFDAVTGNVLKFEITKIESAD